MTEQAGTSARSFCGFSKIATFTSPPLCRMHHRQLDRAGVRPLRFAMSDVETKSERGKSADLRVVSSAQPAARAMHRARLRIIPIYARHGRRCHRARLGDVEHLYGDALDPRRDGARYTVTMAPYPNKLEIRNRLQQQRSTASSKPAASKGGGGWLMSGGPVEPQAENARLLTKSLVAVAPESGARRGHRGCVCSLGERRDRDQ
jgi:hypothetical protein